MVQRGIERTESTPGSQETRFEGPAVLGPEQNLFDQEPFSDILAELPERTGVSLENWHRILGIVLKDRQRKRKRENQTESLKSESPMTAWEIGRAADSLHAGNPEEIKACRKAWVETGPKIDMYPSWMEYVGFIFLIGCRNLDGSLKKSLKQKEGFEPTYGAWLAKKTESDRRLISVGIKEVFPQALAGQSIGEAVLKVQGGKRSRSDWAVRKAAEVVRPSR